MRSFLQWQVKDRRRWRDVIGDSTGPGEYEGAAMERPSKIFWDSNTRERRHALAVFAG
jgi:hypothetical protein